MAKTVSSVALVFGLVTALIIGRPDSARGMGGGNGGAGFGGGHSAFSGGHGGFGGHSPLGFGGMARSSRGRADSFPPLARGRPVAPPGFQNPHFDHFHSGHFHHHFFSHHAHDHFVFFFAPLFVHGFALPYAYYAPYFDEYPYPEDYLEGGEPSAETEFEPYYGEWTWSVESGYFVCPYYLTPDLALLAVAFPGKDDFVYYYDPLAGQYVGFLDRATGEYRRWYADEGRWSRPTEFPFAPPPPVEEPPSAD